MKDFPTLKQVSPKELLLQNIDQGLIGGESKGHPPYYQSSLSISAQIEEGKDPLGNWCSKQNKQI